MNAETRKLVEKRFEQMCTALPEAIRREVEWLERHNFPVWVWENGRVVDASKNASKKTTGEETGH